MAFRKEDWSLVAQQTGEQFPIDEKIWQAHSGNLLDAHFNAEFRRETVDKQYSGLWRYRQAFPIHDKKNIISFGEGMTPVVQEDWEGKKAAFKLEFLFPTGSYKDRGASVMISRLKESGISRILEDSSGNAGCAIAAYAAKAGISCEIFVSEKISLNKLRQLEAYGAEVVKIKGNRDDVAQAALQKSKEVYYASHAWNPFFFQGTKSFAYEIWEQFKNNFPKSILLPVGNGTLLIGAYLGFSELARRNLIPWIPAFFAAQATNMPSLTSNDISGFTPTIAEGISVANPVRKRQILDIIASTGGDVILVSEDEIQHAWRKLGNMGYYVEKTSAVAPAAIGKLKTQENFLVPLTGSGLKISQ